MSEPIYYLCL